MAMHDRSATGIVFFPAFDWSLGPDHPEREERLLFTRDQLMEEGILDLPQIEPLNPEAAADRDILAAHFCIPTLSRCVLPAHRYAAGGSLTLVRSIFNGDIRNGFAAVRPPGHHAFRLMYGNRGFCNINNAAIAAEFIRREYGVQRIAIVDTDVHHCDGTQNIYWHDPDMLVISIHQDGRTQYPGSGFINEKGGPGADGLTLNLHVPPGSGDTSLLHLADHVIRPVLDDFNPEFIINSAGQDCHFTDPLGALQVTAAGYVEITRRLNPGLVILEGGYAIESALPYLNLAILCALADLPAEEIREPGLDGADLTEPAGCPDWMARLTDAALAHYMTRTPREQVPDREYSREVRVFYDTDGIWDHQKETVRVCHQCRGFQAIDSEAYATYSNRITSRCLYLPPHACAVCRDRVQELARDTRKKSTPFNFLAIHDADNSLDEVHPCSHQ